MPSDLFLWTQSIAKALREERLADLTELERLAEIVEDAGIEEQAGLHTAIVAWLCARVRSNYQQAEAAAVEGILARSPSLRAYFATALEFALAGGRWGEQIGLDLAQARARQPMLIAEAQLRFCHSPIGQMGKQDV